MNAGRKLLIKHLVDHWTYLKRFCSQVLPWGMSRAQQSNIQGHPWPSWATKHSTPKVEKTCVMTTKQRQPSADIASWFLRFIFSQTGGTATVQLPWEFLDSFKVMCVNGKKKELEGSKNFFHVLVLHTGTGLINCRLEGLPLLFVDIICTAFFLTTTVVLSAFIGQSEKKKKKIGLITLSLLYFQLMLSHLWMLKHCIGKCVLLILFFNRFEHKDVK